MTLLLLLATTAAVSHELHAALHQDGPSSPHFCLVCSLAKGQALALASVVAVALLLACCWLLPRTTARPSTRPDYRLSPSRAPPLP